MKIKYAADMIVETLQSAGVERVYGITGDSANYITDAIARSQIRFIHTRHEEVAAIAAGADAATSGRLAVCMGSCGPGSLHLVNGLYESHRNGSPVLAIVTDIPKSQIGTDFVQEIDTLTLFRSCSHYCQYVQGVDQLGHILGIAMQTAISRHGVAVVIISGTVSSTKIDKDQISEYLPSYTNQRITPSKTELDKLAQIINDSPKVTIFGGYGCTDAAPQVMELARRIKAPVTWSSRAIAPLDWDNPYPAGMNGILGSSAGEYAISHCDTLLLLGCGFAFTSMYPDNVRIVQIDIVGENLARRHNISMGVVGDIAPTLDDLMPLLVEKTDDRFANECAEKYKHAQGHLHKLTVQSADSKHQIYPERLSSMLNEKIDHRAWVTADMGTSWAFACRYVGSKGGRKFYMSSLHGTMAAAMPSAIGLSLGAPDRQVVALCGDGGISMLLGDLLTIKQEHLTPKIFIFNNSSLDFVAMEMKADGLLDSYTYLENPNFANVATAIGIKGIRVERAADLEAAVSEALAYEGAVVVDVVVNPLSMIIPPHITAGMVESYSSYAAKLLFEGNMEELLEEAVTNLRTI